MSLYLIDYENVREKGFDGVEKLTGRDEVIIFYSEFIKNLPFQIHVELMNSKAKYEYFATHKVGKNYLDFQLATFLGYRIAQGGTGNVVIITGDTGFDSIVDFWEERGVTICRKSYISGRPECGKAHKSAAVKTPDTVHKNQPQPVESPLAKPDKEQDGASQVKAVRRRELIIEFPDKYKHMIRSTVIVPGFTIGNYNTIYSAIMKSENTLELNNNIVKAFGTELTGKIYKQIKNVYRVYMHDEYGVDV